MTGLVTTTGRQFIDWSADYRLFSKGRYDLDQLFGVVRRGVLEMLPDGAPLVVGMDDSILRKTGTKICGVGWRRDPLGPPFHVNFIRAQRVLQLSAALPIDELPCSARMIPIDFRHTPTPAKPRKTAPAEKWITYRQELRESNIGLQGAKRLQALRRSMDEEATGVNRALWVVVDGRFTNGQTLKNLPEKTTLIGRVRKDAKLYYKPKITFSRGRKPGYGERAPTPEQLQRNSFIPWQVIPVFAAGKTHQFKVKTLSGLRWRVAGKDHDLVLIVIAPLAYRPRKGSRLLYRKPAYLISTDPKQDLQKLLQAYVWRWDVEVNFRDEKQLLGVGQAQVRTKTSVESVPALIVASYAMLLLAAAQTFGLKAMPGVLPEPKWRQKRKKLRGSTQDLINHIRAQLWGKAMGLTNFSGFMNKAPKDIKPQKLYPHLPSAVLYAAA